MIRARMPRTDRPALRRSATVSGAARPPGFTGARRPGPSEADRGRRQASRRSCSPGPWSAWTGGRRSPPRPTAPADPGRANWVAGWAAAPTGASAVGLVGATSAHGRDRQRPGQRRPGPPLERLGARGHHDRSGEHRGGRPWGGPGRCDPGGALRRVPDRDPGRRGREVERSGADGGPGRRAADRERLRPRRAGGDPNSTTRPRRRPGRRGGDLVSDTTGRRFVAAVPGAAPWRVVDGIAVAAPRRWSTLVAFGDSITAGYQYRQTPGHPTWPDAAGPAAHRGTGRGRVRCRWSTRPSVPTCSPGPRFRASRAGRRA